MSTYVWKTTLEAMSAVLNSRNPNAGALLSWARWAADSLFYLRDLDAVAFVLAPARGHDDQVVEMAHFRWAASTAATALDLGAAAVGRLSGIQQTGDWELDLQDAHGKKKFRDALSAPALNWVDAVWSDPRYQSVLSARHPMVHRRTGRVLYAGSSDRTEFKVKDPSTGTIIPMSFPVLIPTAIAVTTEHLETLFAEVVAGRI